MGQSTIKFKNVYVEGASGSLRDQFDEQLKISSAKLINDPKGADLHVKVTNEQFQSRTVSLGFSGRSNEFELNYRLEFQLAGSNNAFLPADKPLEITRAYFNDQQDILAKNNEEQVIRREMYQQAVRSILDRASAQIHASAK
ncbi:MAG: LPS assembly lipoprotein LptE [Methylococcaceae bacterium]|nr:LPS assembly lipoprotein LptE [Methylococcaceae bacterium]